MMAVKIVVLAVLSLACLVASQTLNPPSNPAPTMYSTGGSDWTGVCHDGKSQSPIDVYEGTSKKVGINDPDARNFTVEMHYHRIATETCGTNKVTFFHNGNAIEVDGDLGYIEFGGNCDVCGTNKYDLKKLLFRSPSEHTVDGKHMDMELQLVHQKQGSSGNKDLVMVSVLFQLKSTPGGDPFLESVEWPQIPAQTGGQHVIKGCLDLNRISSSLEDDYFAYPGSMSTPPCEEPVPWLVMSKTQGISRAQLDVIAHIFQDGKGQGNNRKVQNLNGRSVLYVVRHPPTTKQIMYDLDTPVSNSGSA